MWDCDGPGADKPDDKLRNKYERVWQSIHRREGKMARWMPITDDDERILNTMGITGR